ncbi:hypothetical protein GTO91_08975 [Heliobacterium undosum]|uniref:Uncharacterized protein n=1 Tax=Heliomicrobium undosum TaxID=121734 RepID=A0A845L7Y2_9FIRM|nr:hypothetical protein [Heliomicrobium undosum]MZP29838.1 hypothetical protein [Heliomicrobium undosum]
MGKGRKLDKLQDTAEKTPQDHKTNEKGNRPSTGIVLAGLGVLVALFGSLTAGGFMVIAGLAVHGIQRYLAQKAEEAGDGSQKSMNKRKQ